jgi:hypothetical protein
MKTSGKSTDDRATSAPPLQLEDEKRGQVLHELDKILESRFFRSAGRSKQFLKYVVQHKLEGHSEVLKERTIGVEIFERPHDYATGEDPVVRVQAGEVRRRLDQYYQATPTRSLIQIELPIGSYSPLFQEHPTVGASQGSLPSDSSLDLEPRKGRRRKRYWIMAATGLVLALGAGMVLIPLHRRAVQESVMKQFWSPIFATTQPVLICLAESVVYRPSEELYRRYSRTHPGTFRTEVERTNQVLPLDPSEAISWSDIFVYADYGVARGDAYAGVTLAALLGKIGKPSQVRIGANYSFEDLRNSPAVVVGAFNNRWTMHLTSNLHFAFVERNGQYSIREQTNGGRAWETRLDKKGAVAEDAAIVARLLNSKTGQFTIAVAGIGGTGTQAAGEFVTNPQLLEEGLRSVPAGWQKKNLEVVLQTTVTDSIPGPPRVVAAYSW